MLNVVGEVQVAAWKAALGPVLNVLQESHMDSIAAALATVQATEPERSEGASPRIWRLRPLLRSRTCVRK